MPNQNKTTLSKITFARNMDQSNNTEELNIEQTVICLNQVFKTIKYKPTVGIGLSPLLNKVTA